MVYPALALVLLAAVPGSITLAHRGHPADCTIVTRAEATPCERYAAEELRHFLKRQTGVELPVVDDSSPLPERAVLVGRTRHTSSLLAAADGDLGEEGFRLKSADGRLLVLGGEGRGPLYGVYELLERFGGCAWYSTRFEVVPEIDSFIVPGDLDDVQRPAFKLRTQNANGLTGHPRFAARNRMNLESFGPELGGSRFRFDEVLGQCHTFERLLPSSRWFASHPEWFAEIDGRRVGFRSQPCLTNPDVRRICTEEVLKRIEVSYPKGVRRYGVSQNDWGGRCRCASCAAVDRREMSPSGTLIEFVNHIAEAVERRYPDVVIQTLAYTYTRRPPKTLAPRRNVQVCLCTIECDFARPIASSRAIENRLTRQAIERWGAVSPSLAVWDYATDFACYLHPWPNLESLQPNLRLFRYCGVRQVFEQNDGGGVNDIWADIRAWLLAKWMWNPDADADALLARCFRDCFGPAAPDVRRCFDELHRCPRDVKRFPMGCFELVNAPGLPDACLDRVAAHLARAAERAKGTPYADNVLRARLPVDFTRAFRGNARPFLARNVDSIDPARFAEEQEGARRVAAVLASPGGLRFAGDWAWDEAFRRRLLEFAERPCPVRAVKRLTLEEWNLVGRMPTSFRAVADTDARDGRAVLLPSKLERCIAWFRMDKVITDPDGRYVPRVRVKVGCTQGEAGFRAGVYNRRTNRAVTGMVAAADAASAGRYVWHSLEPFSPKGGDAVWIGLAEGPSRPDVWIDCIELVRLE